MSRPRGGSAPNTVRPSARRGPPVGTVDVLASAAFRLAPRALRPGIDRLRLDVGAVVSGFLGPRPRPFSTRTTPPPRPVALDAIDPIEHALPRGRLRRSWVTLRTDLRWLVRDLRGRPRPVVVSRRPSQARQVPASRAASSVRTVEIVSRHEETADAVTLVLRPTSGPPLRFEAGQFMTFLFDIDGRVVTRAYSLSGPALDGAEVAVTVKRVPGGLASTHVIDALRPGMRLRVRGPSGSFVAPPPGETRQTFVMVAGGSGITPVASIVETVLARRDDRIVLLYGSRDAGSVIFRERLDALAAAHRDRFDLTYVFGGQLDTDRLGGWLDRVGVGDARFVCGPEGLRELALAGFRARGVEDVRVEHFFSRPVDAPAPPSASVELVTIRLAGRVHEVEVAPGETVLDAARRARVDVPFSCTLGGCAACKGRLLDGEVVMDEPNCLSPRERADGWVLTCCARPRGSVSIDVEGT